MRYDEPPRTQRRLHHSHLHTALIRAVWVAAAAAAWRHRCAFLFPLPPPSLPPPRPDIHLSA